MSDIGFLSNVTTGNTTISNVTTNVYNDVSFTVGNDLSMVNDHTYVKQKVTKILLSLLGRDPYFTGYGTTMKLLLFSDIQDPVIQTDLTNEVVGAIGYLESQEESLLPSEKVTSIDSLQLSISSYSNEIDLTLFLTIADGTQLSVTV